MERVLICEDNQSLRVSIGRHVRNLGYATSFAADGEEALRSLEDHNTDLIILDSIMPFMLGAAALKTLRRDPRWKDIPVIMISACQASEVREAIGEDEVCAVVCKFDGEFTEKLVGEVKRALALAQRF